MIEIILNQTPVSWSAPRLSHGIAYNPRSKQKTKTRNEICRRVLLEEIPINGPIFGYVALHFTFCFKPPKSASAKEKEKMLSQQTFPTRMDTTNLQKFYEDCIKDIVIEDDRYVIATSARKIYGEKEKVVIKVFSIEEYNTFRRTCE
jgi:Holliday junction resolvase RusA-like endonuclease